MHPTPLPAQFYSRPTQQVARDLLGKVLVHEHPLGTVSGRIVEVEAYLHPDDAASHSFRGMTARNAPLFGPAGHAYVYFTYGMHYCMNVVTERPGEAVLIRALEPLDGVEHMRTRRRVATTQQLCSGPAKLTQALALDRNFSGLSLLSPPLCVCDAPSIAAEQVAVGPRIGIAKSTDLPLRFWIESSQWVSR